MLVTCITFHLTSNKITRSDIMAFKKIKKEQKFKGKYIVFIDDDTKTVYSTNSIFWRDFFS